MIRIDIYSDVVCPWCLIGRRRLSRALAERPELDTDIRWRAFQLNPDMPAGGIDRREYLTLKFGTPDAGRAYEHIRRSGLDEGIEFRFDAIGRTPNTVLAHRLIRRAGGTGDQTPLVDALFDAYFVKGEDIGSIEILPEVAGRIGWDRDETRAFLDTSEADREVREEDLRARTMGIQGVPCFIVNDRYAISGAQEPEYFLPLFDLAGNGEHPGE